MNKFRLRVVTLEQHIDEQLGEASASCRLPRLPEREGTSTARSKRSPTCRRAGFWLFALTDLSASKWALSHWDVTTEDTGRIKENCRAFQLDLRDHLDLGSKYKCKYKYISYQCSCYFTNQGARLQRDLGDLLETCFIQNRVGLALQPVQNSSVPPPSLEDPGLPVA